MSCLGGVCAVGDHCIRGFSIYSDRDMVGLPMACYFRRAFLLERYLENFIVVSWFVCVTNSDNLSSHSDLILMLFGRDVFTVSASLFSGFKPLKLKQSQHSHLQTGRLRHRMRTCQQQWMELGVEPGAAVVFVSQLQSFRSLPLSDTHPGLAVVTH